MPIRVLRVMEYTYPDITTYERDMALWQCPANGHKIVVETHIRSATLPLEVLMPDAEDDCP